MRQDVLYARTGDGLNVPIVDVTNPAFRIDPSEQELAALTGQFLSESTARQDLPPPLVAALQRSVLGRGLMAARGTFLSGMHTYLMKLGPDSLWDGAEEIDRRIAASFPAFTNRLRVQDMARLLADGILAAAPTAGRALCFVNIAGGPAADSWNALLLLRAQRPDLLATRRIVIAVLDPDREGPAFGAVAFDRLREPAGPLAGLDLTFEHRPLAWSETAGLRSELEAIGGRRAFCAASSEGGLFEYGSDEEILEALTTLAAGTAADAVVAGSVTRDGEATRASHRGAEVAVRPRTLDAFGALVKKAGWMVERTIERPLSYHVLLVKLRSL
jgi:hypothetical protein